LAYKMISYVYNITPIKKTAVNLIKGTKHISAELLEDLQRLKISGDELYGLFDRSDTLFTNICAVPAHLLAPRIHSYRDLCDVTTDETRDKCSNILCVGKHVNGWKPEFKVPVLYTGSNLCVFCMIEKQELAIVQLTVNGTCWENSPTCTPFYMSVWFDPTTVNITPIDISEISTFVIDFKGTVGGYHPEKFYQTKDLVSKSCWKPDGTLD
ncbi:hypothetical protein DP148_27040, partial [Salmonella enterica subsp. enterica serovar Typhimurium]